MGHQDPKDKIFKRWYQSRHFTAPIEDFFKGREPQQNNKRYLSMHPKRDPHAPIALPPDVTKQHHVADTNIQSLEELRRLSRDRVTINRITRKIAARKEAINRQQLKIFRTEWFKARPGEILRSQGQQGLGEPTCSSVSKIFSFEPDRQAVIEALYPIEGHAACSRLETLERLVTYCKTNLGDWRTENAQDDIFNASSDGAVDASSPGHKQPQFPCPHINCRRHLKPFTRKADLSRHLQTHNKTRFPCPNIRCTRYRKPFKTEKAQFQHVNAGPGVCHING